ncbi:hypothetical protein F4604DRAFT_1917725 [Suillus subluteus]|nr:hypothetical protein F4604DRAFT_1917725 [Suillus subluteus]
MKEAREEGPPKKARDEGLPKARDEGPPKKAKEEGPLKKAREEGCLVTRLGELPSAATEGHPAVASTGIKHSITPNQQYT